MLLVGALALATIAYSRTPGLPSPFDSADDPVVEAFVEHLREGYARSPGNGIEPQFMTLHAPLRACIVSEALNVVAERTLDTFERLVGELSDMGTEFVRTPSVDDCPEDTFMFVNVHDGGLSIEAYSDWANDVFMQSRVIPVGDTTLMSWGGAQLMWSKDDDFVYLVSASQVAPVLPDDGVADLFVRTVLTQELFQVLTLGDDLEGRDSFRSILHEVEAPLPQIHDSTDREASPTYEKSVMQNYLELNATGLCHVDLMVVVLLTRLLAEDMGEQATGVPITAIPMADVEPYAREHHAEIEAEARRIAEGGQLADILDASCSY